jgi:hypothetical protein
LVVGQGVLDGNAPRGVLVACRFPGFVDFGCGDLVGFVRWRLGIAGVVAAQSQVSVCEVVIGPPDG